MNPKVSVVIPVLNAGCTIGACLQALRAQRMPKQDFEVIIVDGGSQDNTLSLARSAGVRVIVKDGAGIAAARNTGIVAAKGEWIAFTDADCLPCRDWLRFLLAAATITPRENVLGVTGRTLGYPSSAAAARYVSLTGGTDAARHLSHSAYPFAPACNLMYRRSRLLEVAGFDERYLSYPDCDLHTRLLRTNHDRFLQEPRAIVLHQFRDTWRGYWNQQLAYGRGYAQFLLRYQAELQWSSWRELKAWVKLGRLFIDANIPGSKQAMLVRRGNFIKQLAQRIGIVQTYFNHEQRARWKTSRSALPLRDHIAG